MFFFGKMMENLVLTGSSCEFLSRVFDLSNPSLNIGVNRNNELFFDTCFPIFRAFILSFKRIWASRIFFFSVFCNSKGLSSPRLRSSLGFRAISKNCWTQLRARTNESPISDLTVGCTQYHFENLLGSSLHVSWAVLPSVAHYSITVLRQSSCLWLMYIAGFSTRARRSMPRDLLLTFFLAIHFLFFFKNSGPSTSIYRL